jgi:hypothetical protein
MERNNPELIMAFIQGKITEEVLRQELQKRRSEVPQ